MVLSVLHPFRRNSKCLEGCSRLLPGLGLRALMVDATDPEARDNSGSEDSCLATDAHQASARKGQRTVGAVGSNAATSGGEHHGPVRAAQRRKGERRKVLPVLGGDTFTSNVASILVRWPHTPPARQPRNWLEVTSTERFRWLFPRRPTLLTEQATQGLKALAASGAYGIDDGGGGLAAAAASGSAQYDAHQAALSELVDRLQALQRHLQDATPDDDENGNDTIVAVAAFTADDDIGDADGEGEPSALHLRSAADPASSLGKDAGAAASSTSGRGVDKAGPATPAASLGRHRRRPAGWQRGPKPAPPWDDTQPFQTSVGTVYHFWRMCPYG
ncbi:hypothetical protein PLESTM_000244300 [Pleodorina starrii]|nr:hypothetical protein PLESTM_000244300 [Pleodorina starrii]